MRRPRLIHREPRPAIAASGARGAAAVIAETEPATLQDLAGVARGAGRVVAVLEEA